MNDAIRRWLESWPETRRRIARALEPDGVVLGEVSKVAFEDGICCRHFYPPATCLFCRDRLIAALRNHVADLEAEVERLERTEPGGEE